MGVKNGKMGVMPTLARMVLSKKLLLPKDARVIFVYHDISNPGDPGYSPDYSTSVNNFFDQINFIEENFEIVSLDEIHASSDSGHRLAAITFDDGFYSILKNAHKFLYENGIPYTIFLNSEGIVSNKIVYNDSAFFHEEKSEEKIYLDRNDVFRLKKDGVEFGNHTSSHQVLSSCDETLALEEISENKKFLEESFGIQIKHFAIPYGKGRHYSARDIEYIRSTGHSHIYTTDVNNFGPQSLDPAKDLIPRIPVTDDSVDEMIYVMNRSILPKF